MFPRLTDRYKSAICFMMTLLALSRAANLGTSSSDIHYRLYADNMVPDNLNGTLTHVPHRWQLVKDDYILVRCDIDVIGHEQASNVVLLLSVVNGDIDDATAQLSDVVGNGVDAGLISDEQHAEIRNSISAIIASKDSRFLDTAFQLVNGGAANTPAVSRKSGCGCTTDYWGDWIYQICSSSAAGVNCDTQARIDTIAEAYEQGVQDMAKRSSGSFCFCSSKGGTWWTQARFLHRDFISVQSLGDVGCEYCGNN